MALPKFDEITLPFLLYLSDGKIHHRSEYLSYLKEYFHLSDDDLIAQKNKPRYTIFDDRVYWARYYLMKAGCIEQASIGNYKITNLGMKLLDQKPVKINEKCLTEFSDSFREWMQKSGRKVTIDSTKQNIIPNNSIQVVSELTPNDQLSDAEDLLKIELFEKVRSAILKCSASFFEKLVVQLLEKMGYGIGEITGKSGDGGIDGIIYEDKLGLEKIHIQAKRYENNTVGSGEVQSFIGALVGVGADKGVFITLLKFSASAKSYVKSLKNQKVILIDGDKLLELMIDHDLGVSIDRTITIKKIDMDYFEPDE